MVIAYLIFIFIALFKLHRELEHYAELEAEDDPSEEVTRKMKSIKLSALFWAALAITSSFGFVFKLLDVLESNQLS